MRSLHFEKDYRIRFPAAQVWPLLADTDRMNRFLGLPSVEYAPTEDAEGRACLLASATYRGVPMKWYEYPFQWREREGYTVRRVFLGGPLAWVEGGATLREEQGTSIVTVLFDVAPRGLLGRALARMVMGPQAVDGMRRHCERIAAILEGREVPARATVDVDVPRLEHKLDALAGRGFPRPLLGRLRDHLARSDDMDVMRMRPFALADGWREDRREVLRLFLHATSEGVLSLSWNVLCPNCRVPKADFGTLRSLQAEAHCEVCRIDFEVDFDRLVELRFNVRPDIRKAQLAQFCIGGPRNTPHVLAQGVVAAGERWETDVVPGHEGLRLRVRETGGDARAFRDPETAAAETCFVVGEGAVEPRSTVLSQGAARIAVENRVASEITVIVEREDWASDACSAALVSTMAEFRRLFSSEVLAPNIQVGIQNVAVLFSDLRGSTRFYQEVGDAQAFAVVRDHFDILGRIVEKHDGTFVKTMGDAIMAVFLNGREGLKAAIEMQQSMQAWEDARVPDRRTFVKIGLHQGPVISVTFNDRLDYFGSTVNMAARVQAQSVGGDVVISQGVHDDPGVGALLESSGVAQEPFRAELPGFADEVPLWRLRLA
jgi:class 3 adenylate cyclase